MRHANNTGYAKQTNVRVARYSIAEAERAGNLVIAGVASCLFAFVVLLALG